MPTPSNVGKPLQRSPLLFDIRTRTAPPTAPRRSDTPWDGRHFCDLSDYGDSALNSGSVGDVSQEYDLPGRVISLTKGGLNDGFTYDALGRVTY